MTARGSSRLPLLVGAALAMIALAIAYPLLAFRNDERKGCLPHVKQCSTAMIIYAADYDDRFPDRDCWVDLTMAYLKNDYIYHCPDVGPPKKEEIYGYAFNSWLAPRKATDPADPAIVPMLYDTINFAKNSSDPFLSFPMWPTGKEKPRRNVAFADGHAKLQAAGWKGWKP